MSEHDDPWRARVLGHDAQIRGFIPNAFVFWRNIAVLFCVFSVVGHWLEIGYCSFMDLAFGVIEEGYPVWNDPMEPYMVYGVAAVVCALVVVPLKIELVKRCRTIPGAVAALFAICVALCLAMELGMGLLLNQPDAFGEYPLWDNSELPLNILGQAWLVNDVLLGFMAGLYVWVIYPICLWLISLLPERIANIGSLVIIAGFVILCIFKLA